MKTRIRANENFHRLAGETPFDFRDKRVQEYRRCWEEWPEKFHVGYYPLFVDIEVTSACNLRCPFCATTFRGKLIKKGFMSFEVLKKIIDESADNNLYGVKFNIRGEPLLHPKISDFVLYAKKKGLIDVYFNTNAMLLTEDMSKKLLDAGLDRMSISFEGYTKEVYEKYRVGAKFDKVIANINKMQAMKKKIGVTHPRIRIQTVMLPEMENSFEEYKKFWIKYVDEVAYLDYKEMEVKKKGVRYPWACPQIWQRMAVWWDGTILPCNHDDDGLIACGNINNMTIKEVWNSEKLNRIRDFHKRGLGHEIPACDGCYLRDSEIVKLRSKKR
jgi:radical SAM protein with 4Fe4S-binding SPASM domain